MGYSLRSSEWRYTAWLEFDTNTFLPSLHLPPMAEELYKHTPGSSTSSPSTMTSDLGRFGGAEMTNLAEQSQYIDVLNRWRLYLYEYLWNNVSFAHLFQQRADKKRHQPLQNHKHAKKENNMRPIVFGRYHKTTHPHRHLHKEHYFAYLLSSASAVDKHTANQRIMDYRRIFNSSTTSPTSSVFTTFSGQISLDYVPSGYYDHTDRTTAQEDPKTATASSEKLGIGLHQDIDMAMRKDGPKRKKPPKQLKPQAQHH
jgi:hypothetical protein